MSTTASWVLPKQSKSWVLPLIKPTKMRRMRRALSGMQACNQVQGPNTLLRGPTRLAPRPRRMPHACPPPAPAHPAAHMARARLSTTHLTHLSCPVHSSPAAGSSAAVEATTLAPCARAWHALAQWHAADGRGLMGLCQTTSLRRSGHYQPCQHNNDAALKPQGPPRVRGPCLHGPLCFVLFC